MRLFLAASYSGLTRQDRAQVMKVNPARYLLETFVEGPKRCDMVLNDVGVDNFLMDSGAFTFVTSKSHITSKELDLYTDQLIDYVISRDIKYFFEMDVDTTFGLEKVESLRKLIERKTQRQCIPVWHKERGIQYFKDLVNNYKYIAIGGMVVGKNRPIEALAKMVQYAKNRGVKVHGLGFTDLKHINSIPWYSVDSCSWSKTAFFGGNMAKFTGTTIKNKPVDKKGCKLILSKVIMNNFNEWIKYQKYMDTRRW